MRLESVCLDAERGSLSARLGGVSGVLVLAVDDVECAGQVVAMSALEDCLVRLGADGSRCALWVSGGEWVYALSGWAASEPQLPPAS